MAHEERKVDLVRIVELAYARVLDHAGLAHLLDGDVGHELIGERVLVGLQAAHEHGSRLLQLADEFVERHAEVHQVRGVERRVVGVAQIGGRRRRARCRTQSL